MSRALVSLAIAAAIWAIPDPARAAPVLRHQLLVNGDFALLGNTLAHDCDASAPTPLVGTVGACGTGVNDNGPDVYWRADPATSTALASTAVAPSDARSAAVLWMPDGASVRYARIYWAAEVSAPAFDPAIQLVTPAGTVHAIAAEEGLVIPVADGEGGPGSLHWYQSSADVTTVLQGIVEPRGRYTVGGVGALALANEDLPTAFAAWWMVVFYEDPATSAFRQLTLFDGLDAVGLATPQNVTLAGFRVPSGFDAKLGVVAYEGDASLNNDYLFFKGYDSAAEPDPVVLTTLSDALNTANDFFNGTRSWLGVAATDPGDLPRMSGSARSMMAFDLDVVDLEALGAIKAGDDAARIRATLGGAGDSYALAAFVTSINTLRPSFLRTVKSAVNLTGGGAGTFAGDVVEYVVSTANTGNDPSVGTVLEDLLPAGVTFVPGSLRIVSGTNAGAKSDAAGDDQGEYDAAARKVVVRLGAGANGAGGGQMAMGETAEIRFRVTVDAGASGTLLNQVVITAGGLSGEPPRAFNSTPPGGGEGATPLPVDACEHDGHCGGATPACLVSATPNVCVECTDGTRHCGGVTPVCDASSHACVPLSTLSPAAQEKTTVAGTGAPFALTLTSNVSDVYDVDVGGCSWPMVLWSGATRLGSRSALGAWTVEPGADANGNGLPDGGGTAAGGATRGFSLWIVPDGGLPHGAACLLTVTARGAASGVTASATATLRTDAAATWTPDHTGANAKAVPHGGTVLFPGVIRNNTDSLRSFDVSAVVTASPGAGPLAPSAILGDPDGDGDPADGAPITVAGPVAEYGGTFHVVLVLRAAAATGAPLATGTILSATATATGPGSVAASQSSEARVQYAATYTDAARTLVRSRFAPCDTVHLGAALLPGGFPYALEWYARPAPVRGVDVPVRAVDPWPVSGGAGSDAFALPADAPGTWTVLLVQKSFPEAVLEAVTFEVERTGAFVSLSVPARLSTSDGLAVSASVRSDNAIASLAGSQLAYQVTDGTSHMDGAGAFGAAPATAHLTAAVTVAPGETASDAWTVASAAWPAPGLYRVDASWRLQCGSTQQIASATAGFEVVPAAPAVTGPAPLVSTRTPAISGTGLPGASVTVTVGATGCGPAAVSGAGAWSCTPEAPLPDGEHVARAVQTLAGATSDPSAPRTFTVDATPPAVSILAPASGAQVGAAAAPGRAVAFSGTAEAGAAVTVASGGLAAAAARSGAGWSATVAFDGDGIYTALATATDAAGNSATAEISFTLDTAPPGAPVIGFPADGSAVGAGDLSGTFLTVAGTADPDAVVTVAMGAETRTAARSGSAWSATFEPGEGSVTVTATGADLAGNVSTAASATFTVDTQPPGGATFTLPLDGATLSGADAPGGSLPMAGALAGTVDPGTAVSVAVDGTLHAASVSGASWSLPLTLEDGPHAASAVAVDPAGNASGPVTILFWLDTSTPIPVLDPVAPTSAASVTARGSAESGATVTVWVDAAFAGTTAAAGGAFALELALPEGTLALTASAVDALGNASAVSARATVVVDRTAPAAPRVDGPAAGAVVPPGTVVFQGAAEAGATVSVTVGGATATAIAADGTFSIPVSLPAGDFTALAAATDAAGNVSPAATTSFRAAEGSAAAGGEAGGGGCGCSGAGGASPAMLLLLPLLAALAPRRRPARAR